MNRWLKYTAALISLICLVQISFYTQRHEFATLFATYAVFFSTYLWVLKKVKTDTDINFFIFIGIILRGVAVFSFPNLSDDIYRFLWDGRLVNLGENPFTHTPQYYIENQLFSEHLTPELFSKLNSPNYFSVYPTICQCVFSTATFLFPKSIYGASVVIKLFLFACELGSIFLIKKMTKPNADLPPLSINEQNAFISHLIYALNPLTIIELVANAHFEAAMIFFFLFSIFLLKKGFVNKRLLSSAALFSLSVVSKMLPLIFLPLFLKRLGWKKSFYYWLTIGLLVLILLLPIYNSLFFNNIGKSLSLYFVNFEFNASIYYLLEAIGFNIYGFNLIHQLSPYLILIVLLFIAKKTFFDRKGKVDNDWIVPFFNDCLMVVSVYFACATTVHPWYAALPLACSVFTTWRFPMVWTFFIFLTYAGYTEGSSKHTENIVCLIIEYSAVYAFFIFEWISREKEKNINTT